MDAFLSPQGLAAAAALIFMAGLSDGVATRGVVLLVNRITPLAFVLGLLAAALLFLLSAALWVWGIWLAATNLFGLVVPLEHFFAAVSVAYGPLLLSALALLPLVGPALRWVLRLWSFVVALGALAALGLSLGQAALCAALGTLLVSGAGWLLSEPAFLLVGRFWTALARRPFPRGHDRPAPEDLPYVIPGYAPGDEVVQ